MVDITTRLQFTSEEVRKPIIVDHPFLAIGDVHGHAVLLEALVDAHSDFEIVLCGDLGDRGPDTVGAFRIAATHGNVQMIEGNHDEWPILLIRYAAGEVIDPADLEDVLDLWRLNNVGDTLESVDRCLQQDPDVFRYLDDDGYDVERVARKVGASLRSAINAGSGTDVAIWASDKVLDAYISGNVSVLHAQRPKHHKQIPDLVANYRTNQSMTNPRPYRSEHPIRWSCDRVYIPGSWTIHGHNKSPKVGQPNGWGHCIDMQCGYTSVTTKNKLMAVLVENDRMTVKVAAY